ncbi:IPT/TIG domain-containing protein [Actinoplanes sp. NPDC026670]|uniref:IPT/TIG domain-containing protein n=1 Tax=Actinoplanes sp. NPDC026670 TaxID=3154700 RepID=UPI0033FD28B8
MSEFVGRAVLAAVAATVITAAGTSAPAAAAEPVLTLSSATGPSGGGVMITGTTAADGPFPAGTVPVVQFQFVGAGSTSCRATAQEVAQITASGTATTAGVLIVRPDTVKRLTAGKIAFEVPAGAYPELDGNGDPSTVNPDGLVLLDGQDSSRWNVCVYDTDSTTDSTLLATAVYTVAPRPVITSIIPAGSPAGGGQSITVNGSGFSTVVTGLSASIGGADLTGIKVAANGNSFTATTGPRAADTGLALVVTAPGGSVSSLDPDDNGLAQDGDDSTPDAPIPFSYSNSITITPNTGPVGGSVDIDVLGAGFEALDFTSGSPADGHAHVFLVKDAYDAAANRGVAECSVVVVISDNELICTLDLAAARLSAVDSSVLPDTTIAEGAYILTVVASGDPTAGPAADPTIISSGATFTVGPY